MKKKKEEKKNLCRTWMGYCLIELKAGLGWALGRRGRRRACRALGTGRACVRGVQGARAAGLAGRWGAGAAGAGAQGERAHGRASGRTSVGGSDTQGARGRAAGTGRGTRGGRLGGLCASGVRSWARLGVLVHLTQFLAWFDSVFS